ncbi:TPA: glutaredoxin family protein [Bacillus wiedmannii]|uniref:glutaredoxin family protein n=1 Tax=Bacillus wiedmannii TaxID=1890302 RepID=UPI0021D108E0|nr:glutaredoxin family protein [Bacillus wiedmannii]MCU5414686.1 glutaredoxin family protein [Bacillus wiedmannii]HDR3493933.1 glutaredoxin family protein [Bacillus wiedmannii]
MATKIVVYTGNACPKCKRAKEMLENLPSHISIDLAEMNVDECKINKDELTRIHKSQTLPTLVIDGQVYRGFDENIGKIMGHLGL